MKFLFCDEASSRSSLVPVQYLGRFVIARLASGTRAESFPCGTVAFIWIGRVGVEISNSNKSNRQL